MRVLPDFINTRVYIGAGNITLIFNMICEGLTGRNRDILKPLRLMKVNSIILKLTYNCMTAGIPGIASD